MFKTRAINNKGKKMKVHHNKLLKFITAKHKLGWNVDRIMHAVSENFTEEELKMSVI